MKASNKRFLWVLTTPTKERTLGIRSNGNKTTIIPNMVKITSKSILWVESNSSAYKNYTKLQTSDGFYYLEETLTWCVRNLKLLRCNKHQALRRSAINGKLNCSYVFIDQQFFKVGKVYKSIFSHLSNE